MGQGHDARFLVVVQLLKVVGCEQTGELQTRRPLARCYRAAHGHHTDSPRSLQIRGYRAA